MYSDKERNVVYGWLYSKLATTKWTGTPICDFSVSLGLVENPTGFLTEGQNVRKTAPWSAFQPQPEA